MQSAKKNPTTDQKLQDMIVIDATVPSNEITRICWNTGEQKNCTACYLSNGCKAKD